MQDSDMPLPDSVRLRAVRWVSERREGQSVLAADVDGEDWVIILGDFPIEPVYTLYVRGVLSAAFNDWPSAWSSLPSH